MAGLCKTFHNRFNAGWYFYAGTLCKGQHEPMITMEEFAYAQTIMGVPCAAETRSEPFSYNGLMNCLGCGRLISGIRKSKWVKSASGVKTYTYYYCANSACTSRSKNSITELRLEEAVETQLSKVTILPEFKELAFEGINRWKQENTDVRDRLQDQQHALIAEKQAELDRLISMRMSGELEAREFMPRKLAAQAELILLRESQ